MRLSDVLSKTPSLEFKQVEGFLGEKPLSIGCQRKIQAGKVLINFFCRNCMEERTFSSGEMLYCIGVNEHLVSLDCVLTCHCGTSVQIWFLVDCDGAISGRAPEVRIIKRTDKLPPDVLPGVERFGDLSDLLVKAQHARREQLGAGAIVYLRKAFEKITMQTAEAMGIAYDKYEGGNPKNFRILLEEVDRQCSIIPREFSSDGYRLFRELSNIVHGEYDEALGLIKFEPLYRLVIGILENIRNSEELKNAKSALGWNDDGGVE